MQKHIVYVVVLQADNNKIHFLVCWDAKNGQLYCQLPQQVTTD